MDSFSTHNLTQKIAQWKAALADLGKRNPLINYRPDKPRSLEVLAPQPAILFQGLTDDKATFTFHLEAAEEDSDAPDLEKPTLAPHLKLRTRQKGAEQLKRLYKLRSEARIALEEKGVNSLFLAFGTLLWQEKGQEGERLRSPLILVPVELVKKPRKDIYTIKMLGEEVVLNPALVLKLKLLGIDLNEAPLLLEKSYSELLAGIQMQVAAQKTWIVEEQVFLSLFSYAKSAMVQDILDNEARIFQQPILQALAGQVAAYEKIEALPESALEATVLPEASFQVLDADASQQVVIEAAKAGASFVVEGPPGTGKSQTIVNMITELIAQGKSVLLVAEKATALRVVYERLQECDLHFMCLNLHHSGTTDKRKLVADLQKTVALLNEHAETASPKDSVDFFRQLQDARQTLRDYLNHLHAKEAPFHKSAFDWFGEILRLDSVGVPKTEARLANYADWNAEKLIEAENLLHQLAKFLPFFTGQQSNVWEQSVLSGYSFATELVIKEKIEIFRQALLTNHDLLQQLEAFFPVAAGADFAAQERYYAALSHLVAAPSFLPPQWLDNDLALAQVAFSQWETALHRILRYKEIYAASLWTADLPELCERYQKYSPFWLFRLFDRQYQKDHAHVQSTRLSQSPATHEILQQELRQAVQVQASEAQLQQADYPARQVFGTLFTPALQASALAAAAQALTWRQALESYALPLAAVKNLLYSPQHQQQLRQLLPALAETQQQIRAGLAFLSTYFQEATLTGGTLPLMQLPLATVETFLSVAHADIKTFQHWLAYQTTYQALTKLGLERFLQGLRRQQIAAHAWFPLLERQLYHTCLEAILAQKPALKHFDAQVYARQREVFATLDHQQLQVARWRLKARHAQRFQEYATPSAAAELLRLQKEATKKSRHLAIRKLLNDPAKGIPTLAKHLKPCWLMSPLSVSQYIDPDVHHFDVLIFDEASQLRTEDVVAALIRADQVIVIGDRKQLPPTTFFASQDEGDADDDAVENYESLLDECSNFMVGHLLKWHYRSQDERLITFSNTHFYQSRLVTFPNPRHGNDLGLRFHYVADGIYDRGKRRDNPREAATVVQLLQAHIQNTPEQSLGIIAFSEAQADAIQEAIEKAGRNNAELEAFCSDSARRFFLKALENVQGNEADAIILSVGYARDAAGKLLLNFGPLNKSGGERRLNVAITRAKTRITVVASLTGREPEFSNSESTGVRLLREYLEYAASAGERLHGQPMTATPAFASPFEAAVFQSLIQHPALQDYRIASQIGCSDYRLDLAIAHKDKPEEFILGIECDGAAYQRSPTTRTRDRLREQVLKRLGWRLHRIWSTAWFRDPNAEIHALLDKLKAIGGNQA